MHQASEWLPSNALVQGVVFDCLCKAIESWSTKWLGTPSLTLRDIRFLDSRDIRIRDLSWNTYGEIVGVSLSGGSARRLLARVIQSPVDQIDLTPADQKVLNRVEESVISDLTSTVEISLGRTNTATGAPAPRPPFVTDGVELRVSDETGANVLSIGLPTEALVSLRKSRLPMPEGPSRPLRPFSEALADQFVRVEARVGRATIPLSDLESLGQGDLLVLDKGVEEPVEIVVDGSEEVLGYARLAEEDGHISLSFY